MMTYCNKSCFLNLVFVDEMTQINNAQKYEIISCKSFSLRFIYWIFGLVCVTKINPFLWLKINGTLYFTYDMMTYCNKSFLLNLAFVDEMTNS